MTVADLIKGAFKVMGVLAAEETPSAAEQSDAFDTLNDLLDSWANEELAVYTTERNSYVLTPGLNPHTIGPAGTFSTTRPLRVDRASIVLATSANAELPLMVLSDAEWQLTQGKTSPGTPAYLWVETSFPLAKLWLNPVPVNADTLVLYAWHQLGRFLTVGDTVSFPPGYQRALRYNLARELCPEYGVAFSAEANRIADDSKSALKSLNSKPAYLRSDPALLRPGPFNVVSGDKG